MRKHGASLYHNGKCRCEVCTADNARVQREAGNRRAERVAKGDPSVPHGRASTYTNWKCRCDACKADKNRAVQERKARKKEEAKQ